MKQTLAKYQANELWKRTEERKKRIVERIVRRWYFQLYNIPSCLQWVHRFFRFFNTPNFVIFSRLFLMFAYQTPSELAWTRGYNSPSPQGSLTNQSPYCPPRPLRFIQQNSPQRSSKRECPWRNLWHNTFNIFSLEVVEYLQLNIFRIFGRNDTLAFGLF